MNIERYTPGIGVVAGIYRLKWKTIFNHVNSQKSGVNLDTETINVFINFESILDKLSSRRGLNSLATYFKHDMVIELESSILNLVGNYKSYFKTAYGNNGNQKVKVYFYHTAMDKQYTQQMEVYNKYYRNFYFNKYTQNPKFRTIGGIINEIIIPEIKLILSYIPDCYFLESTTFDGSIIPYIVSTFSPDKNIIITGDRFDTLYYFNPNFIVLCIEYTYPEQEIMSSVDDVLGYTFPEKSPFDISIFNSELYYRLLMAVKGSKIRNIRSDQELSMDKFMSIIKRGLEKDIILKDFGAIDSVIELFPNTIRADIKQAFQCMSIENQYSLLSETDIDQIRSQIVDKVDIESVEALNNKRFVDYPINLQMLLS